VSSSAPLPATTTRVVLPGVVEPAGLEVVTAPVPAPGPGRLLVAVEATGISYAEQAMRKGRYFGPPSRSPPGTTSSVASSRSARVPTPRSSGAGSPV
jgi:NADPH:quinone reductase-like Zn-dependent oxidoreductase